MSTAFAPAAPDQTGLFTVEQVTQRTVNKRDGTSFTLYEIRTAENAEPFSTTKRQIAESAHELVGSVAELHYQTKVNGQWTNYYLQSILPRPLNPVEAAQRAQEAPKVLREAAGLPEPSRPLPAAPSYPTDRDLSIFRQTAAKVAAVLSADDPLVFWENVQKLTRYFETGDVSAYSVSAAEGRQAAQESNFDDIPF